MKTRNQKRKIRTQRKTRKMKGGYIHFVDGEWKAATTKPNGLPVGPVALEYSKSEANFFNKLRVGELQSTRHWLSNPNNANVYLERLAPGILDDVPKEVFQSGLLNMRNAISSLSAAYEKRSASDREIDEMTPERRSELGITTEDQERHKERTFHMKIMLKSIKEFMIPYEEKEDRLNPKPTVKAEVKQKPANPFLFLRTHKLSETLPSGAEAEPAEAKSAEAEPAEASGAEAEPEAKGAEVRVPKGAKKKGKEKTFDVSTYWMVASFNYQGLVKPTSLCFSENKMFIVSKDLITFLVFDGTGKRTAEHIRTEGINSSFCNIKGNVFLVTFDNKLFKIQFDQTNLTTFKMEDIKIAPKGLSFLDDRAIFFVDSNKLYQMKRDDLVPMHIPLKFHFNKSMGLRAGREFIVIADSGNHRIVIVNYQSDDGEVICTTIGDKIPGLKNGKTPKFNTPMDVLILPDNSILVSDTGNHSIRRIYKIEEEWITETIAGNGTPGLQDGIGEDARFNEPHGLTQVGEEILVADKENNVIRVIKWNVPP